MKTPAEKISLDANALANIIERRLRRVSGLPENLGFALAISVPQTSDDIDPEFAARVIYVSNCERKDGIKILSSLFGRWLSNKDDNAYFAAKMLKDIGIK